VDELKKIHRVIGKAVPGAPHEVLLMLDATMGQNAVKQADVFRQAVDVTGIALAKLDGTAKGGVVLSIARDMQLPIRFVGIGEAVDDLRPFDAREFASALFAPE
jgi:fused signal recognition particle receptor